MSDALFNAFSAQEGVTKEQILEEIQGNNVNHANIDGVAGDLDEILGDLRNLMYKANGRVIIILVVAPDGTSSLLAAPVGFKGQLIWGDFTNAAEYHVAYEKMNVLVEGINAIDSFFNFVPNV